MRLFSRAFARVLFIAFFAVAAQRWSPVLADTGDFDAVVTATPPPVTGTIDDLKDPIWMSATHVSAFTNVTSHRKPFDRTDAYVVFTKDEIVCAFVADQTSAPIVANQRVDNVGLGLDDYVSLMFDTAGNGTNQYFFETTPAGIRYQTASESTRYDPSWTAKASIAGSRWFAEMEIPYRFLRSTSPNWRINFARYNAQHQSFDTYAYAAAMSTPFDPTFWNTVRSVPYVHSAKGSATAEVYGLGAFGGDRHVFEGAAGEFDANTVRNVGIDAKIPLTAGLNLVGTLDPDFSNVENDQVVTSPQEFRYQYAEYRPFFTQGANYLPSSEVFYSPSIGVFNSGEKIEGAVGQYGIGLLNVDGYKTDDRAYSLAYTAANQEFSASLQGAQAQRSGGTDDVYEANVTGMNRFSRVSYGGSVAAESGSFTPDAGQALRSSIYAGVSRPNYSVQAAYFAVGPQYDPLDSYVAISDIKGPSLSASLASTVDDATKIRQLSLYAYADRYVDGSGAAHETDEFTTAQVTFKNLTSVSFGTGMGTLRDYIVAYPKYIGGSTSPFDQTTATISYRGGTPDTAYAAYSWGPYANFYLQQVTGVGSYQISKRLSSELDYNDVTEKLFAGPQQSQTLRRLTLFGGFSSTESLSIALRNVSGAGGFALPGENLAIGFRKLYRRGNTLTLEYGSPASGRSLDRFVVKYVLLVGGGSGE